MNRIARHFRNWDREAVITSVIGFAFFGGLATFLVLALRAAALAAGA